MKAWIWFIKIWAQKSMTHETLNTESPVYIFVISQVFMLSCLLKQILFQHNTACFFTAFKLSRNIFQLVSNHGVRNKGNCVIIDWVTKKYMILATQKNLQNTEFRVKIPTLRFSKLRTFLSTTVRTLLKGSRASEEAGISTFVEAEGILQQQRTTFTCFRKYLRPCSYVYGI